MSDQVHENVNDDNKNITNGESDNKNNKSQQRSSDPSYNKLVYHKKLRIASAPVGDLKSLPYQGNDIIKKGPLLKLSGSHRFRKWKWIMCYIESGSFSYHPMNKSASIRRTIDLNAVNPFTLPSNDIKFKKLKKFTSKNDINWDEVRIMYFMPISEGKIRYFAVNNDQLDEWIISITLAKQNAMNKNHFNKNVNFDDDKIKSNEIMNSKNDKDTNNNDKTIYDDEIGSTKEIPFTELSSSNDDISQTKRYTLVALRRSNILDFEFDSVE